MPAHSFYGGDVLNITAEFLRKYSDEIEAKSRSSDLDHSIDQQAEMYGLKKAS
jgi:hypothetical protein